RHRAIHLLGKRMADLFRDDAEVTAWVLAQTAAVSGTAPSQASIDAIFGRLVPEEMSQAEDDLRVQGILAPLPEKAEGREALRALVDGQIAMLTERLAEVEAEAAWGRALAVDAARVDVTTAGKQILQYTASNERSYHAALRRLAELQKPQPPEEGGA